MTIVKSNEAKATEAQPDAGATTATEARDAPGARARDTTIVTDGDSSQGEELVNLWADEWKRTWRRLGEWTGRDAAVSREHPASLHDLALYWAAAPMAGGNPVLRWLQRLDGFTLGLAFTFVGYTIAWLGQRPLRRVTFLLFAFVAWRFT